MTRKIIHLDLDAFFCAVEELRNPALAGKPFAVGGKPEERGVVASCSYPARRRGVHSAMPMAQAVRLCPGLIIVPGDHRQYRAVSRQVMVIVHEVAPLVEQISIDEAFLDVTELAESAEVVARALQARIRHDVGLPCSLGVATNKLVAKIANNVGKAAARGDGPPNALCVVPPGGEAEFLAPLPCGELWGVGPKTAERLAQIGIRTIGEIAKWPADDLARRFGKHGEDLARHARGNDTRPVTPEYETKSISQETTFTRDVTDGILLRHTLRQLSQGVSRELKRKQLTGVTIKLKLRWSDFTTPTRQLTLDQPVDAVEPIYAAAVQLFDRLWQPGQPVRLLGVGVSGFDAEARQLSLWDVPDPRTEQIAETVARLRERYGKAAVVRGSELLPDEPDMD